jgi:hypothetical protein
LLPGDVEKYGFLFDESKEYDISRVGKKEEKSQFTIDQYKFL